LSILSKETSHGSREWTTGEYCVWSVRMLEGLGDVALVHVGPIHRVGRARIVRIGRARPAAPLLHELGVVEALVVHRPLLALGLVVDARERVAAAAAALVQRRIVLARRIAHVVCARA